MFKSNNIKKKKKKQIKNNIRSYRNKSYLGERKNENRKPTNRKPFTNLDRTIVPIEKINIRNNEIKSLDLKKFRTKKRKRKRKRKNKKFQPNKKIKIENKLEIVIKNNNINNNNNITITRDKTPKKGEINSNQEFSFRTPQKKPNKALLDSLVKSLKRKPTPRKIRKIRKLESEINFYACGYDTVKEENLDLKNIIENLRKGISCRNTVIKDLVQKNKGEIEKKNEEIEEKDFEIQKLNFELDIVNQQLVNQQLLEKDEN